MHRDLELELRQGLRPVTAPPELWDRLHAAQAASGAPRVAPGRKTNRALVWAMAATVVLMAVGLSLVYRQSATVDEAIALQALAADSRTIAFHCQNPAQLRAWVRAKTGFDLPLRAESSPSIQLIGAQMVGESRGVEVAYRAGNRDAVLIVSRADGWAANAPHRRTSGNVSSWVMAGQRYTLASGDPGDLQLACKLCHLD